MNVQDCYLLCTNSTCSKLIIGACNYSNWRGPWISFWWRSDRVQPKQTLQSEDSAMLHAGNKAAKHNPFSSSYRGVKYHTPLSKCFILMRPYWLKVYFKLNNLRVEPAHLSWRPVAAQQSGFSWNLLSGTYQEKQAHSSFDSLTVFGIWTASMNPWMS